MTEISRPNEVSLRPLYLRNALGMFYSDLALILTKS